jgi:hypothetical protein
MSHIRCRRCNGKVYQKEDIMPYAYKLSTDSSEDAHRFSWCCKPCYIDGSIEDAYPTVIHWNTIIQDEPDFEKHLNIMYSIIELIWNGNIDF